MTKFSNLAEVMEDLQKKVKQKNKYIENSKRQDEHGEVECSECNDREFILERKSEGYEVAIPCSCRERKAWKRRFKNALIPSEFENASLEKFEIHNDMQNEMYDMTVRYLQEFEITDSKKVVSKYNFGFIAVLGEQRFKELPAAERAELKQKHNNFGIGKTHLQIALAKKLIKKGFNVLVVSDTTFMDELMQAKKADDEGESFNRLLTSAINADVLVWDDIGKVSWTEAREQMYYTIINERYRRELPIVFSSNEDRGSLAEKIGYAATSRLIGRCGKFILETENTDWRLM